MNFIDTHAHIDYKFEEEKKVEDIVNEAKELGVTKIICVASAVSSLERVYAVSEKFENVYFSLGIHPHDAKDFNSNVEKDIFSLKNKKCVAIGECGLDYYYYLSPKDIQKKVFLRQTEIARELNLPLIIHTREADIDTYEIIKSEFKDYCNGVIHCYTGNKEQLKKYLDMGMYASFTGIITFPKADAIIDAVKYTPDDRIMIETDAPYLAPIPYRGKVNYPKYVVKVAEKIAEIKNLKLSDVADITSNNAIKFFNLY